MLRFVITLVEYEVLLMKMMIECTCIVQHWRLAVSWTWGGANWLLDEYMATFKIYLMDMWSM